MAKLYYGSGNCSIEGSEIRGVEIRYRGAIEIEDKTSDSFVVLTGDYKIIVFPVGEGTLNELFDYTGEFKIISIVVAGADAQKVPTTIHRVMDYTELLNTNAEEMTTKSEDLSATHTYGRKVAKTTSKQQHLNNQHTSDHVTFLYLKDEDGLLVRYEGLYHIHLSDGAAMTGGEHTKDSQDLFFYNEKPTKNPSSVPYGAIEQQKRRKTRKIKSKMAQITKKRKPTKRIRKR